MDLKQEGKFTKTKSTKLSEHALWAKLSTDSGGMLKKRCCKLPDILIIHLYKLWVLFWMKETVEGVQYCSKSQLGWNEMKWKMEGSVVLKKRRCVKPQSEEIVELCWMPVLCLQDERVKAEWRSRSIYRQAIITLLSTNIGIICYMIVYYSTSFCNIL